MKELLVELGSRSYPIWIGPDLLSQKERILPYIASRQVMVVSNTTVAPLYLEKTKRLFEDFEVYEVILPDGEQYKTQADLMPVYDALLSNRCDRQTTLVALGGGVIGDMTGFAAATYQRGVPFIQIPTTLLSQVDSSVGGKTGVNHPLGKNMIGAFYQPRCVVADINTLDTLEDRQLVSGIAEVIKYGLLGNRAMFDWLEGQMQGLIHRNSQILIDAIEQSCRDKATIVAKDELEAGMRALLNLGHTFGHAIESALNYQDWLHGEAVAVGMFMATYMSWLHGWIDKGDLVRVEQLLRSANLPVRPPTSISRQEFLDHMLVDKKVKDGKVRLVLLRSIGQAFLTDQYDHHHLLATLDFCLSQKPL